jgi:hypothetical protein
MVTSRSGKRACAVAALVVLAAGLSVHAADPTGKASPSRLDVEQIRQMVERYACQYDIPQHASSIAKVIHLESRGFTAVRSKNGLYVGLCQFMPHTFVVNVDAMKKAGLLPADQTFSPLNPEHAVQVMVWMWSQGLQRQWGPARRMKLDPVRPINLAVNRNGTVDAVELPEKAVASSATATLSSPGRAIPSPLHGQSPMEPHPSLGAPFAFGSGAPGSFIGPVASGSSVTLMSMSHEPSLITSSSGLKTPTP